MSFFDIRFNKKKEASWVGLEPPDFSIGMIITDLRWHNTLYKTNDLPVKIRVLFCLLRICQLTAYHFGWKKGSKHED